MLVAATNPVKSSFSIKVSQSKKVTDPDAIKYGLLMEDIWFKSCDWGCQTRILDKNDARSIDPAI